MNIANKNFFKYIILVVTLVLVLVSSVELLDYMITYKYHIEENFDHKEMIVSYKERKIEIEKIIIYLKIFIAYFILIIGYITYLITTDKHKNVKI